MVYLEGSGKHLHQSANQCQRQYLPENEVETVNDRKHKWETHQNKYRKKSKKMRSGKLIENRKLETGNGKRF